MDQDRNATSARGLPSGTPRGSLLAVALAVALVAPPSAAGTTWQPTIDFPDDPLIHTEPAPQPGWVKFLILTADPSTVHFQDSNAYPFHYDFAVAELPAFAGMSPAQFDAVTLHAAGQQAHLGAVFIPAPAAGIPVIDEFGIQLVRDDPYPPAEAIALLATVASKVNAGPATQAFYMPSLAQASSAEAAEEQFATAGFPLASTARWADGNACYSRGWALGDLVQVDHEDIELAFLAGLLTPDDILLTDGIPAEIPQLSGVISLAPATPSSHVAILAQTFDIPFVHLAVEADAQAAVALVGRRVALRAIDRNGVCEVRVVDTEETLDAADAAALLDLKTPPPLAIDAIEPYGAMSAPTDPLLPSAIRYFGGKAANTGVLRQSIPANTRVSVAFSFDLWEAFLDQTLPGGDTLRQRIATTLAPFAWPPDVALLDAALDDLRETIEDDTVFAPALESAVLSTLQDPQYGFVATDKLRFRSSTNVEDSDRFTGAGLYDSNSGCLADDLDADPFGPSLCDASDPSEDGVFDAIRKVYASFFNLNATIERLRYGVPEGDVGMALLVHHSFPDADELANGVATLEYGPGSAQRSGLVVAQPGSSSVTNPEPGWIPEEVDLYYSFSGTIYPTLLQPSNLVLLGETVLEMPAEYEALGNLMRTAADRYATVTGLTEFVVEFELKKTAPGGDLVITQIRRIPQPSDEPTLTPFLLDVPTELCTLQGEFSGSVFAIHRNKLRATVRTASDWLDSARLESGFYADVSMDLVDGCLRWTQSGPLDGWPGHAHAWSGPTSTATDLWAFDDLQHARSYTLQTDNVPAARTPRQGPLVLLSDLGFSADYTGHGCFAVTVEHDATLPDFDWQGPTTTSEDYVLLCRCPQPASTDLLRMRSGFDGAISIVTEYRWPKPAEVAAGYTAPLIRFERTTIAGLTASPLVLTDAAAQTYKPGHHNFTEEFLFEPALDPGLSPAQRDELAAAGVRALHMYDEPGGGLSIDVYDDAAWGYHCLDCRGPDDDGDGYCLYAETFDCDDGAPGSWATPGEATALGFVDETTLRWSAPAAPGGAAPTYDLLRADAAGSFGAPVCVADGGTGTTAVDGATPGPGAAWFYLVRAVNDCPAGNGPVGVDGAGAPRVAGACP